MFFFSQKSGDFLQIYLIVLANDLKINFDPTEVFSKLPLKNTLILVFFSFSYLSSTPAKLSLRLSFAQSRIILRNKYRVSTTLNKTTKQCDIYQATKLTTCNFSPVNVLLLASMTKIVAAWSVEMQCFLILGFANTILSQ